MLSDMSFYHCFLVAMVWSACSLVEHARLHDQLILAYLGFLNEKDYNSYANKDTLYQR